MSGPERVTIIGGGCGGITAAWELSRPEHGGRYEVTVYQQGWRLGGKGASGRGAAGRIEEHGLHVWLGYYDNSFRMLRECYAELDARGLGSEFGSWRDAFTPEPDIGLFSTTETSGWQLWRGQFPPRPGLPGDPPEAGDVQSMSHYLGGAVAMLQTLLLEVEVSRRSAGEAAFAAPDPAGGAWSGTNAAADPVAVLSAVRMLLGRGVFATAVVLVEGLALLRAALETIPAREDSLLLRLAEWLGAGLKRWMEDNFLAEDPHRHVWEVMDLMVASIVGALRAGLLTDPRGFDAINDHDCRAWLRLNGASERSIGSPFVQGLYDLSFAYEDGDAERPAFAAGDSMRGAMRLFFGYRGAPFWRMRAGMGDVVFAPLFRALQARGVRFEFFHRLTDVGLAPGAALSPGDRTYVASLDFDVQAKTRGNASYDPLVKVAGRPCWPATADYAQLSNGKRLEASGVDFESHWDRRGVGARRLEVGRDFDFVVLAVSIGAVPHVCKQLLARDERWRQMVANVKTVATQAFQVWLTEDLEALGWSGPPYIVSAFDKPFDTWCDLAHVVPAEGWANPPATSIYFCSALADPSFASVADDPDYPGRRAAEVHDNAVAFLVGVAHHLWPGVRDDKGRFRWNLLADAASDGAPPPKTATAERFRTQYWRANVNPTERYVLSLPGSSRFRISPLDMTYDNLTIAGDWTECGLNTGCTEAAVMSGRLAAHAISTLPEVEDIIGYDHP
jgi:uncharacterized protein with NAD-binding domain and iron-sulfur cluster